MSLQLQHLTALKGERESERERDLCDLRNQLQVCTELREICETA